MNKKMLAVGGISLTITFVSLALYMVHNHGESFTTWLVVGITSIHSVLLALAWRNLYRKDHAKKSAIILADQEADQILTVLDWVVTYSDHQISGDTARVRALLEITVEDAKK